MIARPRDERAARLNIDGWRRSEKFENCVSESSNPNAIYDHCEPECGQRPSRSKRPKCLSKHDGRPSSPIVDDLSLKRAASFRRT
jgi:hypothetical protein